jgi:hypothetical protein
MNIPPPDQEAIAKEWAMRHPGFIRPDSALLKGENVNEKRKRGAQPGNTSARKYQTVEKIPIKQVQETDATLLQPLPKIVQALWSKYLLDADENMNINQLSRMFLKKLIAGELSKQ